MTNDLQCIYNIRRVLQPTMDQFLDNDDFEMLDILIDELHDLVEDGNVHEAINLNTRIQNTYELS